MNQEAVSEIILLEFLQHLILFLAVNGHQQDTQPHIMLPKNIKFNGILILEIKFNVILIEDIKFNQILNSNQENNLMLPKISN